MSRATVSVTYYGCNRCGEYSLGTYHSDPGCEGLVIRTDGEWTCADCGVRIDTARRCFQCGSPVEVEQERLPVDYRRAVHPTAIEQAVHKRTNAQRKKAGYCTISFDYHLSGIAQRHSRDMAMRGYFAHESPDGTSPKDRYRISGHEDRQSAENLSLTYPDIDATPRAIAVEIVDGWMDSNGHRQNILEMSWTKEGIGVFLTRDGGVYTTQNFY